MILRALDSVPRDVCVCVCDPLTGVCVELAIYVDAPLPQVSHVTHRATGRLHRFCVPTGNATDVRRLGLRNKRGRNNGTDHSPYAEVVVTPVRLFL